MQDMKKLLGKLPDSKDSKVGKDAKKLALGRIKKEMTEGEHKQYDGMKGLKEVKVASDSKEGLEEGLDTAKDLLNAKEGLGKKIPGLEDMSAEESLPDVSELSLEQIEELMAKLSEAKAQKESE